MKGKKVVNTRSTDCRKGIAGISNRELLFTTGNRVRIYFGIHSPRYKDGKEISSKLIKLPVSDSRPARKNMEWESGYMQVTCLAKSNLVQTKALLVDHVALGQVPYTCRAW